MVIEIAVVIGLIVGFSGFRPVDEAVSATSLETPELGCVCAGPSIEERIEGASAVFLGLALDQESSNGRLFQTTFLVEKSWKGPEHEFIEIRSLISGNCGAHFLVGETYIVIAKRDPYGLHQFGCFSAIRARRGPKVLELLGDPNWVPQSLAERKAARDLFLPDKTEPSSEGGTNLSGLIADPSLRDVPGVLVELHGGRAARSNEHGRVFFPGVRPGLYLVRLTLPDGAVEEHVLKVRCDQYRMDPDCTSYSRTFYVDYETPVPESSSIRVPRRWNPPVDSTRVLELLEESASSWRESESLLHDDQFRGALLDLFKRLGGEASVPPDLRKPVFIQQIDSLVGSGLVEQAFTLAESPRHRNRRAVIRAMAEHGMWKEAIAREPVDSQWLAVGQVLRTSWPDSSGARARVAQVNDYFESGALSVITERAWQELVEFLGPRDVMGSWELAYRRLSGPVLAETLLYVLDELDDQDPPLDLQGIPVDSLISVAYAEVLDQSADDRDREGNLEWLKDVCEEGAYDCSELDFSSIESRTPIAASLSSMRHRMQGAFFDGDFDRAHAIADSLGTRVTEAEYALSLAMGLNAVGFQCRVYEPCGAAYDRHLRVHLPALDKVGRKTGSSRIDSLNLVLASLWVPIEPDRARLAVDRIGNDSLRFDALGNFAGEIADDDFERALDSLVERGTAESVSIWLEPKYLEAMSQGNDERATLLLSLMPRGVDRLRAQLAWARKLVGDRNEATAVQFAMEALGDWDPSVQYMRGWSGQFGIFIRLDAFDDLIDWALSIGDPDDRAGALAAIVGSISR